MSILIPISIPARHREGAKQYYKCAILTISTSKHKNRTQNDISGSVARSLVTERGHEVVYYDVIPDIEERIYKGIIKAQDSGADFIITTGGTGLTKDDVTIETVSKLMDKELPGFGELFRLKSYEQIGNAAILSRATAGVIGSKAIFCLPGSPDAVRLALAEIILPEIPHIMRHVQEKSNQKLR